MVIDFYPVTISHEKTGLAVHQAPIIRGIVSDLIDQVDRKTISRNFHNTLVWVLADACIKIRHYRMVNRVALSGGVFQNALLLAKLWQTTRGGSS